MPIPDPPPAATLDRFGLSDPDWVMTTDLAHVWRVQRAGTDVALKIYHAGHMDNEAAGFRFMTALKGEGAIHIYDVTDDTAVMEWVPGQSLGDTVRAGDDMTAARQLVETANTIHARPVAADLGLETLHDWFAELFALEMRPEWSARNAGNIKRGQAIAAELLATQTDIRPLHGDLHHDNIYHSARGLLAIDAKGVMGDRTYELANAFSNPLGAMDLVHDPARIARMADIWSDGFDMSRTRLLRWAAAKCAISVAWNIRNGPIEHTEFALLAQMLAAAEDA